MGCCLKKIKKNEVFSEEQIKSQRLSSQQEEDEKTKQEELDRKKKEQALKVFDVTEAFSKSSNNRQLNELVKSFKNTIQSSLNTSNQEWKNQRLPGPKSFAVPRGLKIDLEGAPPADPWGDYDSHKFLSVNIVEAYLSRPHLPKLPDDMNPKVQEAFMTLNLLRDDPEFIIENLLEECRSRFFIDNQKPILPSKSHTIHRFTSYSFGVVKFNSGQEIIDECIGDIRRIKNQRCLEWSNILENSAFDRVTTFANRFIDKKRLKNVNEQLPLSQVVENNGGQNIENPFEIFQQKPHYGFELMLLMLLDDSDPDRKNRKALLNRNNRLIGMVQMQHPQFDYVNCVVTCSGLGINQHFINYQDQELQDEDITFIYDQKLNEKSSQNILGTMGDVATLNAQYGPDEKYRRNKFQNPEEKTLDVGHISDKDLKNTNTWVKKNGIFDLGSAEKQRQLQIDIDDAEDEGYFQQSNTYNQKQSNHENQSIQGDEVENFQNYIIDDEDQEQFERE